MLPAFSWCLSQVDRDEKLRNRHYRALLWEYKNMIEVLADFHQVTRGQIEGVIRDMHDRYIVQGYGTSAVEFIRIVTAISLGDAGILRERLDAWAEASRDSMSSCAACVLHQKVRALLFLGEADAAIEALRPLVERQMRCISKPEMTYCWLLIPMLKLGRYETAAEYHSLSLPKVLKTPNHMDDIAHHLSYLAVTGQFVKALRIFETGANWLMTVRRGLLRLTFLQNAIILFEQLAAATSNAPVSNALAEELPFHSPEGLYVPATLAGQLASMERELRESFNLRNGNTYLTSRFEALRSDVAHISPPMNPTRPHDIPEQSSP